MATKKTAAAPDAREMGENEHEVQMTVGAVEIPKRQAAVTFSIGSTKGKVGTLKVSRGSLSWKVGNQKAQSLTWPAVASLFANLRAKKTAKSTNKSVAAKVPKAKSK